GILSVLFTLPASLAFAAPDPSVLDDTHASVRAVMALQAEVTSDLMKTPEILGTAVGQDNKGAPALLVFVDRDNTSMADVIRALPPELRGIAVKVELTDKFRAYKRPTGGGTSGVSHKTFQSPPIQLGTSGGWRQDLANGYCCGGTIGSLVQVN